MAIKLVDIPPDEPPAEAPNQPATPEKESPTAVYRHFSKQGALLYVGCTRNPVARLSELGSASWVKEISKITIEWFDTRKAAFDAEAAAIKHEKPRHNLKGGLVNYGENDAAKLPPVETPRRAPNGTFDRTAYQREYMRLRRQKDKQQQGDKG